MFYDAAINIDSVSKAGLCLATIVCTMPDKKDFIPEFISRQADLAAFKLRLGKDSIAKFCDKFETFLDELDDDGMVSNHLAGEIRTALASDKWKDDGSPSSNGQKKQRTKVKDRDDDEDDEDDADDADEDADEDDEDDDDYDSSRGSDDDDDDDEEDEAVKRPKKRGSRDK